MDLITPKTNKKLVDILLDREKKDSSNDLKKIERATAVFLEKEIEYFREVSR